MRIVLVLAVCLWATGCTSSRPFVDEPIIDRKGVDMSRYYADKAECEAYADEVRTGEKVARGAVGGAVVGGAIGAIIDREPNSAERGAGVGAVNRWRPRCARRRSRDGTCGKAMPPRSRLQSTQLGE